MAPKVYIGIPIYVRKPRFSYWHSYSLGGAMYYDNNITLGFNNSRKEVARKKSNKAATVFYFGQK